MIKSELISRVAEQNPKLFAKDVEKSVNAIFDGDRCFFVQRGAGRTSRFRNIHRKDLAASTSWTKS